MTKPLSPISMTEADAVHSMRVDGMLAPVIDEYRPYFRVQHAAWFDFSKRINRLAMRLMNAQVPVVNGKEIRHPDALSMRLTTRAIHAFGGVVALAERGQTIEAGTIVRGMYETGFWIGYLAKAPLQAAEDFITEEMKSQLGRDKASKKVMADDAQIVALIDSQIEQTKTARKGRKEVPGIEQIAILGGFPDHYAYYKSLCGASAHPTLLSTHSYLSDDGQEQGFYGLGFGPDEKHISHALALGCHALSIAIIGFCGRLGFIGHHEEVKATIVELNGLMARTPPT